MKRVELVTASLEFVAVVEIPPFVSPRMPDVVIWGSRIFQRQVRPDADERGATADGYDASVELVTASLEFVAVVEIPPFVSPRMPDVVIWGSRIFQRQVRPDADERGATADGYDASQNGTAWHYVECFAIMSLTPSPGLPRPVPGLRGAHLSAEEERARRERLSPTPRFDEPIPPVDRTAVTTLHGMPVDELRAQQAAQPTGQHADYIVLTDEERAKGFVRPVRRTYRHLKCGTTTTMGQKLAETYAREPSFYGATFCCACDKHFPVGAAGEFVWEGTDEKVGT